MFMIKKDEWQLLLVGVLVFIALNWLMVQYDFDTFTHARRGGFYSMFHGHVPVSGYDDYTAAFRKIGYQVKPAAEKK